MDSVWKRIRSSGSIPELGAEQHVEAAADGGWRPEEEQVPGWRTGRLRKVRFWVGAAAAVLVIAGASLILWPLYHPTNGPERLALTGLENPGRQPKSFLLPDGSTVWLNGHSKVAYASDFNFKDRKVKMEGEAFFDVKAMPEHPFSVEANGVITTVLGTSFNIDAYRGEQSIHVGLAKGKVKVSSVKDSLLLTPGDMATFSNNSHKLSKGHFMVEDISEWINGKLVLDQVDLQDALQRIYLSTGVIATMDAKLRRRALKISGTYELKSVKDILESIAFVHRLKVIHTTDNQFSLTN